MNRRDLCKLMGMAMAFPSLSTKVFAEEYTQDKFLLLINIEGGWDTTLCLDPWTLDKRPEQSDLFIEYSKEELIRFGNGFLGPTMQSFTPYFSNMAVINGIFLSETDNGHEAAERYMMTGSTKNDGSMAVRIADTNMFDSKLGVISNENIFRGGSRISTSSTSGIAGAFDARLSGEEFSLFSQNNKAKTPLAMAIRQMVSTSPKMKQVFNNLENMGYPGDSDVLKSAQIIASCFKAGATNFAELNINPEGTGFDTHSNHEGNHKNAQIDAFSEVAQVLNLLNSTSYGNSGESLLDKTTIMVTSEFSRTAALNSAKGKDHNPMTNSAILLGNGIKGGSIVGKSTLVKRSESTMGLPYQIALPYDFQSQEVITKREDATGFIKPESIYSTLAEVMGVQVDEGSSPLRAAIK